MAATLTASCTRPVDDPLKLEGNLLTVDNRTAEEWTNVEIWLNAYFRVTTSSIPKGGRFQVPLDAFVAGFGQRFNFRRMQIKDLRLKARLPDGTPLELTRQFSAGGLAAVFEKWGKR